jgi:arylsulfatase A-like enzyme
VRLSKYSNVTRGKFETKKENCYPAVRLFTNSDLQECRISSVQVSKPSLAVQNRCSTDMVRNNVLNRLVFTVLIFLTCCSGKKQEFVVADLIQLFPLAEVSSETSLIDFGTPGAEDYLVQGWSGIEANKRLSYLWSDGPFSSVRMFFSVPRDILLTIRCWPFRFPNSPEQTIGVSLNGQYLQSVSLKPRPEEYQIRLPANLLKKGNNLLMFQYGYARQPLSVLPVSSDRRKLAVAWDFLRIDGPKAVKPSIEKLSTDAALLLPSNSYLTYHLVVPNGSALSVEKVQVAKSTSNQKMTLKVLLTAHPNLRKELTLRVSSGDSQTINWKIPDRSEKQISLTVMAVGENSKSSEGSLELIRPVIHGPKPVVVNQQPSKTIARLQSMKSRVNIIVYILDALRADHLGTYGYRKPTSPNIDQLAKEGILFENAFAQAPYTLASVASLFTSRYPTFINKDEKLAQEHWTLAEVLKASAYRTLALSATPFVSKFYGTTQGFDKYKNIRITPDLNDSAKKVSKELFPILERVSRSSEPFFIYIHSVNPHSPYIPPDPYFDAFRNSKERPVSTRNDNLLAIQGGKVTISRKSERDDIVAQYDGNILFADFEIGAFAKKMKELGLAKNTIVIITSDHGEEFFDHGGVLHGGQLFDEMIHVPLILWSPVILSHSMRISTNVELVDIMPTIIDFALIRESYTVPEMEGQSLLNLMEGKVPKNDRIYSYEPDLGAIAIRDSEWKFIYSPKGIGYGIARSDTNDWLFNLKADSRETQNLATQSIETAGRLRGDVLGWLKAQKEKNPERLAQPLQIGLDETTKEQLKALGYIDE